MHDENKSQKSFRYGVATTSPILYLFTVMDIQFLNFVFHIINVRHVDPAIDQKHDPAKQVKIRSEISSQLYSIFMMTIQLTCEKFTMYTGCKAIFYEI